MADTWATVPCLGCYTKGKIMTVDCTLSAHILRLQDKRSHPDHAVPCLGRDSIVSFQFWAIIPGTDNSKPQIQY